MLEKYKKGMKLEMNGGQTGGEIGVYIEFIAARLPTLQILGEKKVIPYLKFNTPVSTLFL